MYYLLGGSGVPNYGDELMAAGWLRYLNEEKAGCRVVIDTNLASASSLLLQHENRNASHVSIVRTIANERPHEEFWNNFLRGYKFFVRGGFSNHPRISMVDEYLRNTKVFHLFGGGYVSEKWPKTGFLLGFVGSAKAEYGFKLVGTGLGLTPLSSPPDEMRKEAHRVLNRFDILELRDPSSQNISSEISQSSDPIYGLDDSFLQPVGELTSEDPTLHISCFLTGSALSEFIDRLSERKNEIGQKFSSIKFWSCAPHRDNESFDKVKNLFPYAAKLEVKDLINNHRFGRNDVMITTRFHPHMVSARSGIRGYFVPTPGRYYEDKHNSVLNLGSTFLQFSDFSSRGFDLDQATEMSNLDPVRVSRKRDLASEIYN